MPRGSVLRFLTGLGAAALLLASRAGAAVTESAAQPNYFILRAEQWWLLNLPNDQRFDASGLALLPDGSLLTVNDRAPGLWRVEFNTGTNTAELIHLRHAFTPDQLAPFSSEKIHRYDCEGVARDEQGRLYVCEEANRWILRFDPKRETLERLAIDWSPVMNYFHPTDINAGFEGVAVGDGKLYVANERQQGVIIVVNLATLKVEDHFIVKPTGTRARDAHYSDLSWFDGELWVLCRDHHRVLRVNPASKSVLAEYDYKTMEHMPDVTYVPRPSSGTMEGLAVDRETIWLVTDNNGRGRWRDSRDTRPTLFKCKRPEARR